MIRKVKRRCREITYQIVEMLVSRLIIIRRLGYKTIFSPKIKIVREKQKIYRILYVKASKIDVLFSSETTLTYECKNSPDDACPLKVPIFTHKKSDYH